MNIWKGIGAILAGMVFIFISHAGTDFVLEKLGIFTPPSEGFHTPWMVVTATIYRCIFTAIGGYITAALAPNPPMRYVMILGLIGLLLSTLGAIVTIPMKIAPALVSDRARSHRLSLHLARRSLTPQAAG